MVVIGGRAFTIVPKDDPLMVFMAEFDPDHVELMFVDTMVEVHQTTRTLWGIGLDSAVAMFGKPGDPQWVCPD